jgi:hypothetical protein
MAQPIGIPAAALATLTQARAQALGFDDNTPPDQWVDLLGRLGQAIGQVDSRHTTAPTRRPIVLQRPLCYTNPTSRDLAFNSAELSDEQKQAETTSSALLSDWNSAWAGGRGMIGLVASPTGTVNFQLSPAFHSFEQEAQQKNYQKSSAQYNTLHEEHRVRWYDGGGYWQDWHATAIYSWGTWVGLHPHPGLRRPLTTFPALHLRPGVRPDGESTISRTASPDREHPRYRQGRRPRQVWEDRQSSNPGKPQQDLHLP